MDPRQRAAVAERIKPVGRVDVAVADVTPAAPKTVPISSPPPVLRTGTKGSGCTEMIGDKAAWEPRLQAANGSTA